MSKETFIIRTEWYEAIAELEPTDQATIFRNLFLYHLGDTDDMVLDTFGVKLVWKLIEPTLSRNMDAFDRKVQTNRENGKLGGRPVTKPKGETQTNPNNQTVITSITQTEAETLSDSDSDSVSVSDSDSDSVPVQNPLTPDSNKNYPDLALPAPGPENNEDSQFYEIEICKNLRIPPDKLIFIWNKWMNSRRDRFFTKREARNDFRSYASSIAMDPKTIQSIQPSSQPQKIIEYAPSG